MLRGSLRCKPSSEALHEARSLEALFKAHSEALYDARTEVLRGSLCCKARFLQGSLSTRLRSLKSLRLDAYAQKPMPRSLCPEPTPRAYAKDNESMPRTPSLRPGARLHPRHRVYAQEQDHTQEPTFRSLCPAARIKTRKGWGGPGVGWQ